MAKADKVEKYMKMVTCLIKDKISNFNERIVDEKEHLEKVNKEIGESFKENTIELTDIQDQMLYTFTVSGMESIVSELEDLLSDIKYYG